MRVHFESVRDESALRGLLKEDGWELGEAAAGAFDASHPGAADQQSARSRLHKLGLLISARLRIEFGPDSALSVVSARRPPRQDQADSPHSGY